MTTLQTLWHQRVVMAKKSCRSHRRGSRHKQGLWQGKLRGQGHLLAWSRCTQQQQQQLPMLLLMQQQL